MAIAARSLLLSTAVSVAVGIAAARAADVPEITIVGRQLPPFESEQLFSVTTVDRSAFDSAAQVRLDDILRSQPGFTLFRRQSSSASHPTTQGVTLRGLGPSGAGRTLVLLDGIPQNDPFGGWIDWSRLPATAVEQVSIMRGGGAGQWGNAALAGTIGIATRTGGAYGDVHVDSRGGVEAAAHVHRPFSGWSAFGTAAWHSTGGAHLIREDQRGPVDIEARSRGGLISAGAGVSLGPDTEATAAGTYSMDKYVNGLALAVSKAHVGDANVNIIHDGGLDAASWELHGYYREQVFRSIFTAVNTTRTAVTPSLDQFRVPAKAAGGSAVLRIPMGADVSLQAGADVRSVDGETNERLTLVNGVFTRLRRAGGEQITGGAFAEANWDLSESLTLTGSLRADYWETQGRRVETAIDTGAIFINDRFPKRNGRIANYRIGLRWQSDDVTLRAVNYSGFRAPTLNELFRPFRVGNDITEANPGLKLERLNGVEAGFDVRSAGGSSLTATVFHNRLANGIGNVTIQSTPGLNPVFNVFVPAGGVLRQRQNIRRSVSYGFEADTGVQLTDELRAELGYLFTDPEIKRSDVEPALAGKRLAQVSRHQGTAALHWRQSAWTLRGELRATSASFEDDLNSRTLKGYILANIYAGLRVTDFAELSLSADNVFDTTIEAGKSADGRITIGAPRIISAGVRVSF
ncbi:MAG: TonB-dependent receptor [Rhodospirillaceae bacterium]